MYTEVVQYSSQPSAVMMLMRPDGFAEYRLTKNIRTKTNAEFGKMITAEEVYFEVAIGQTCPTVEDINAQFDVYWEMGKEWKVDCPVAIETRVRSVEEGQASLEQQLELLLGGDTE